MDFTALRGALGKFFKKNKGASEGSVLFGMCTEAELPDFLVTTIEAIRDHCALQVPNPEPVEQPGDESGDPSQDATDDTATVDAADPESTEGETSPEG